MMTRSLAPLASVLLVLVVFLGFVVGRLPTHGKRVKLPTTMNHCQSDCGIFTHAVSITPDGLWWDQERVADVAALRIRIAGWTREASNPLVVADADVPFAAVRPVLVAISDAGMSGMLLATRPAR
jgi:biopolymer transport protein ExbD